MFPLNGLSCECVLTSAGWCLQEHRFQEGRCGKHPWACLRLQKQHSTAQHTVGSMHTAANIHHPV